MPVRYCPIDADSTYPPAFLWSARLLVVGLIVLCVVEVVQGLRGLFKAFRK